MNLIPARLVFHYSREQCCRDCKRRRRGAKSKSRPSSKQIDRQLIRARLRRLAEQESTNQ